MSTWSTLQSHPSFSWHGVIFDKTGAAPSFEFVRKRNSIFSSVADLRKKSDNTAEEIEWAKNLENYRFMHYDELDESIAQVLMKGYLEETTFEEVARDRNQSALGDDLEQQFAHAWRLFHESFDDNAAEVIAELSRTSKLRFCVFRPPI